MCGVGERGPPRESLRSPHRRHCSWFLTTRTMGDMTISRILHWWWDGPQVPLSYARFRRKWEQMHPDWEMKVWDERTFLAEFGDHPAATLYQQRDRWSPRAHEWGWKTNIARLVLLQSYGGVWVDADLEPLSPIDSLIEPWDGTNKALAAREDAHYVNNAFLAAVPDSPFINDAVDGLEQRIKSRRGKPSNVATGAHYLTELAQRPDFALEIVDRELIYPVHWSELHRLTEQFPGAYTLHHWHRKSSEKPTRSRNRGQQRSGPTSMRKRDVNTLRYIRRIEGLTTEPACLTLADMAKQVPAEHAIVELGVYQARTALYLVWGASQGNGAHVWGFDAWDLPGERVPYQGNRMRRKYTDTDTRSRALRNVKSLGYSDRMMLTREFSAEAGRKWVGPPVGLLFVDADHTYEGVRQDFRTWASHLAEDATIVFDDYHSDFPMVVEAVDALVSEGILGPVEVYHDRLAVTRLTSSGDLRGPSETSPQEGDPETSPQEGDLQGPPETSPQDDALVEAIEDEIERREDSREQVSAHEVGELESDTTIDQLTVFQLRELAQARGIRLGRERKSREAVIAALREGE